MYVLSQLHFCQVCLPSIVDEFCQQAEAANLFSSSEEFAFSDSLESEHSKAFGGMERLDMFFPFDPCLLRKSDRYALSALGSNLFLLFFRMNNSSDCKFRHHIGSLLFKCKGWTEVIFMPFIF